MEGPEAIAEIARRAATKPAHANFRRGGILLLWLNVIDGLFTVCFLELGLAHEANPLMRLAYEASPLVFMGVKLLVVGGGVLLLWAHRDTRAARFALAFGLAIYSAILGWHLAFLTRLATAAA